MSAIYAEIPYAHLPEALRFSERIRQLSSAFISIRVIRVRNPYITMKTTVIRGSETS